VGVGVALFFFVTALTGLLLGWKKDSAMLQPLTIEGSSSDLSTWKGFQDVSLAAMRAMDSIGNFNNPIDRLDVRPDKGVIKVLFKNGYWEVQVDGTSGKILSVAKRHSDWIEHLHDGSIMGDLFKLVYTNVLGIGLLTLAFTGIYMWYAPRIVRRSKDDRK
jgi:hypothetical protein